MLSSRIKTGDNDDDDDDNNEGQSIMPGDYETPRGAASRFAPVRPIVPSTSRPSRQPPIIPSARPSRRPPPPPPPAPPAPPPPASPKRTRRSRKRSLTPEIIIERRRHHHHHRHHHSSSGRHRIFTISLDNRPTLGLRGPPKRVLEIERIPCRRRRKHHSTCYEIEYEYPPPLPPPPPPQSQPQSNIIIANPISDPCLSLNQSSSSSMISPGNSNALIELFSNLTPEIIQNLPKQTIHLPPVYMPGSQANTETGLETVVFPAEIINPIDGTLSIIQSNSSINNVVSDNIQPPVLTAVQPQLINVTPKVESPLQMLASASGPFMQQVHDLFQRMTLSQPQPSSSPFNNTFTQPVVPVPAQNIPSVNSLNNSRSIPSITNLNAGGSYPPANIRPIIAPNNTSYNSTTITPSIRANVTPYRPPNIMSYPSAPNMPYSPANITPYRPVHPTSSNPIGTTPYRPGNVSSYNPTNNTPYRPANITPYQSNGFSQTNSTNIRSYYPPSTGPSDLPNTGLYRPPNSTSVRSYAPPSITPSNLSNTGPYQPANITPYQPTTFTPANPTSVRSFNPSNLSTAGPYRPANITPYNAGSNRFDSHSLASFNSSSSDINNRLQNVPYSSHLTSQTPYQSSASMPKSILRNPLSTTPLNTTYTRFDPPNILSPNTGVRELATAV